MSRKVLIIIGIALNYCSLEPDPLAEFEGKKPSQNDGSDLGGDQKSKTEGGSDSTNASSNNINAPPTDSKESTATKSDSDEATGVLSISLETSETDDEDYAPSHVMAVWIEKSNTLVKTVMQVGKRRDKYLKIWAKGLEKAGLGDPDAVSGATFKSHGDRSFSWDGTSYNGEQIDDGTLSVCMELTDRNGTGNYQCLDFTKGPSADVKNPSDHPSFSNVTIKWTP